MFLLLLLSLGLSLLHGAEPRKTPPEAGTENLLKNANANFENFDLAEGNWKSAYGKYEFDTNEKISGEQSLKPSNWCQLYNTLEIPVEPGYVYYIGAWSKIKNFKFVNSSYGCGIGLEQYRADGERNGNWYPMYCYLKYKEGDEEWTYSANGYVPKDSTTVLRPAILVKADPGSEIWIDDLQIWREKLPEKQSQRLLNQTANGSFEVLYNSERTPFGFVLEDGEGQVCDFGTGPASATNRKASNQSFALEMRAAGTASSGIFPIQAAETVISLDIANELPTNGDEALVAVELYNQDKELLSTLKVAEIKNGQLTAAEGFTTQNNGDWQQVSGSFNFLNDQPPSYGRWIFKRSSAGEDASGVWLVDNLSILQPTDIVPMPFREYNPGQATVTVNTTETGDIFTSVLDSYDHHCTDRIYSYSIGTAGEHLEGPGRWFAERKRLGVNYIRVHNGYNGNILNENLPVSEKNPPESFGWNNGETGVTFTAPRINPETGLPFLPVCRIDEAPGEMITDFSSIKYYLDKGILVGGTKPIFGLEPVPAAIAYQNNTHYKPRDLKLWEEFNYRFIKFLCDTYGEEEIKTWIFETGNEPGTQPTFHGTPERDNILGDFLEMQDYTIAGATRALPEIMIAGPSGPPEDMFEGLLKHCAEGENLATGGKGTKLDAFSYHGYMGGSPGDLSWRSSEEMIFRMLRYRDEFEKATGKRLILMDTEFTPIFLQMTPKNPPEPVYDNHVQAVATMHMANFSRKLGVDRMVFFYHSPTYFAPVRGDHNFQKSPNQATTPEFVGESTMVTFHGVFKPVARTFQLLSWLNGGAELKAEATNEPIFVNAVKTPEGIIKILAYNFDLNPKKTYTTKVDFNIENLPVNREFELVRYTLSATKSNSWYLATRDQITQKMCEDDVTIVDRLNTESEPVAEKVGIFASDAAGTLNFSLEMPVFSADFLILQPVLK